jgi:Concanavalin A-like lectin/glucanases superfamily
VAKMAFLLLVVFAFFVLLRLFSGLISYFTDKSNFTPTKLIDGMINASEYQEFKQEPSDPKSKTIYRSKNEKDGIEFTWSVYVFIRDIDQGIHSPLYHVFHKGNYNILPGTGLNNPNNAPGLYINSANNSFKIVMNTYKSINEEINVPNIPRNKWLNVIIRCQNTKIDVYVNGLIAQSYQLNSVPKQNYGSVHVAGNGGFPGFISNLSYYDYALSISEIQRLNNYGPNLKLTQGSGKYEVTTPDYLSLRWYFGGANDQYISPPTPAV